MDEPRGKVIIKFNYTSGTTDTFEVTEKRDFEQVSIFLEELEYRNEGYRTLENSRTGDFISVNLTKLNSIKFSQQVLLKANFQHFDRMQEGLRKFDWSKAVAGD
ncbi:hypothetical protein [Metasolibacillus meyeri]|uniref:hypothetical protein n=1 Tax=Metasolibacillus meyeri TaxID=1071052 RepID=UPI000D3065B6|nr:hypothetical protein [Metasolibacillus meyeri]